MPDRRNRDDDEFEEDDRPRRRRKDPEDYDDEPRPRRRRDDQDFDDDEPRPRRPSRSRSQDEDDYDDEPRRRRLPPEKLRSIAIKQKILIFGILGYASAVVAQFFIPTDLRIILAIPALLIVITDAVFVFLLATEVHGTGLGILFGFLTLIPCLGLIMLLIINQTATSMLQKNGIRVGLLGANMSDIRY